VQLGTTLWNSGYGWGTGTSFSTPVVAGTVALIMSANPSLTPSQIESVLFSTATDLGAAGYDIYTGYGLVNAAAAVAAARASSTTTTTTTTTDTAPPTVAITSPTSGAVSGIVPVSVSAADNVGVVRVELYIGGVLFASDTTAPWSFSWDTTKKVNGTYGIYAKAYDAAGHVTTSSTVSVTVSNGTTTTTTTSADTTPPVAHISTPWNGTRVYTYVTINASATDNVGVASISVYVDGTLIAVGNAASLSYVWNASRLTSGWHKMTATAKDKAGNAGSTTISVYH